MVEEKLEGSGSKDEFQEIMEHIRAEKNFLLSGGAGSGKTFTLVQVIKQVIEENPASKVACMTYTNAAVKEIEERVNHKNLNVTTIHDFLWDNIKHFQNELKSSLISLINDLEITKIKLDGEFPVDEVYFSNLEKGIQYKEYLKLKDGIISHDELLILANHIFKNNPKINGILKDKFKFIFIDEYQDTNKVVVDIFLDYFHQSNKTNVIGFFGDAMQSIYDDSIGNLDEFKGVRDDQVREVQKEQNRRNPELIMGLANRLRNDGLQQKPSGDKSAPNMGDDGNVKSGDIKFIYSVDGDLEKVRNHLAWSIEDTKELNLTHNLIADKAGFRSLMDIYNNDSILSYKSRIKKHIKDNIIEDDFSEKTFGDVIDILQEGKSGKELSKVSPTPTMQRFISENEELFEFAKTQNWLLFSKLYVDKDQMLDDKKQDVDEESKKGSNRGVLIKHLFKIQHSLYLYESRQFNEFLRKTEKRISSIQDKIDLKNIIENINIGTKSIEEIIIYADENRICKIDDSLEKFILEKEYVYNRVKEVKFKEFQKLYSYLEGFTPFSTQHKTKGAEFDNVLVILDNGGWRNYNFEGLFLGRGTASVLERTQKIFYVCCTRAKENLAVYYHNPSSGVIGKAKEWFGEENVVKMD